jgi:tetratricopeptide (TPR) repeat protein
MSREIDKLLERAQLQMRRNDLFGAIETLRRALTLEPDDAVAHAVLSLCLHDQKRLYAAQYEAVAALALDPQLPAAHYAMAMVSMAQRRFKQAEEHFNSALALNPSDTASLRALAHLYELWNRERDMLPLLEKAREIDPDDADTWAALAEYYRHIRDFELARTFAEHALQLDPQNADALLVMGYLLLRDGSVEDAREHALLILRNDANHSGAIHLLAAVKARSSILLGVWWRFNSFVSGGSLTRRVVLLICLFLVYRVASITTQSFGYAQAAGPLNMVWLALCVYSWIGPGIFRRQLLRELAPSRLDPKY